MVGLTVRGGSQSFPAIDMQDERWYVKAPNNPQGGRVVATEFIVSAAGRLIGAPVCEVQPMLIPAEFAGMRFPSGLELVPGVGSASREIANVAEEAYLGHGSEDDNRKRHAGVLALYDWCWGGDGQWLYCASDENRLYSHDHGWYLPPGGADWNEAALLAEVDAPHPLSALPADLDLAELDRLADMLEAIGREELRRILAEVPPQWGIPRSELEATGYFLERRAPAVAKRMRALGSQQQEP